MITLTSTLHAVIYSAEIACITACIHKVHACMYNYKATSIVVKAYYNFILY